LGRTTHALGRKRQEDALGRKIHLFVGCLNREAPYFQGARGKGLAVFDFDEDPLEFHKIAESDEIDNPTFLSMDPVGSCVYANSEVFGWREGTVSAYRFDKLTGSLSYINKQPTLGSITAHNGLTPDRRFLLVVNYGMGEGGPDRSLATFGLRDDGGLTPALASVAHRGAGPNAERQERSHAHSVLQVPGGAWAIVADLGLDRLMSYRLHPDGSLEGAGEFALPPGSGPRHMSLHPNGRFLFVANELDSTIAAVGRAADGTMSLIDIQPAVPAEARPLNHCADIHVSPDGRFVYGSNRGHDSIVVFAVDQESGRLAHVGYAASGGKTPRNFALTPSGNHMLVANQNSDAIAVFSRDADLGTLHDTGKRIEIGTPVCVKAVLL
jgi:6-phosphogluconolactonase